MNPPEEKAPKKVPMDQKYCASCEEPVIDKVPACPLACMSNKCKAYKKEPVVDIHQKPVIWILGGPGCGKGTQCTMIKEKYGLTHVSTGDLLRAEVKHGSERAKCLETIMKRGGLVPNDIVLNLVYEEIKRLEPTAKGFLIDGYPREKYQGTAFEEAIAPASVIIYFETSPETLLNRLMTRANSAATLRIDDTEEAFLLRIETFVHYNQQVLDLYIDKIRRISADGTKEEIFEQVQRCLEPVIAEANIAIASVTSAVSTPTTPRASRPASPNQPKPKK